MPEQQSKSRNLAEISHLFLSNVRQRATSGANMPQRRGPKRQAANAELTAAELSEVMSSAEAVAASGGAVPPVRAILGSHLGSKQQAWVERYARTVAASGRRVGLIVADVSEFRLSTFAVGEEQPEAQAEETGCFDTRAMREALNELSCDVDCWLLSVANAKVAEAKSLLRAAGHWVLLSGCGEDDIVASYRTLKGVAELSRPRLSLAAVGAEDPQQADRVFKKLSSVCRQFLNWAVEPEPSVGEAGGVAECQVMLCRTSHDKAQLASGSHWQVLGELLAKAKSGGAAEAASQVVETKVTEPEPPAVEPVRIKEPVVERPATAAAEVIVEGPTMMIKPLSMPRAAQAMAEVIDLPVDGSDDGSVLSAVMKHSMSEVVECPVVPPMCAESRVAISRDRRIVIVAVAGHGLSRLRLIGEAYQWAIQNRGLLKMALPQFAIDADQTPLLRLLVDQQDLSAEALGPILQVETVSIHTYRRVKWAGKTGLLLEAA